MTPIGRPTTLQERLAIVERAEAGAPDRAIAEELGLSRWTVRKWRRRGQQQGRAGLASSMGRPKSGALSSFSAAMREAIDRMKEAHPGWGPQTLRTELQLEARFVGQRLPSRARIAAYLKEKGFTRRYDKHQDLPQPSSQQVQHPHEEWEMDAQGVVEVEGIGKVSLINLGDVYSGLKIDSLPCPDTSHPNRQDYQLILRRAFTQVGLPQRISLDHDSVFYDNSSRSPFPSPLHLWLIGLGVEVRFIGKPPPMEHSRIERQHQMVFQQAVRGRNFRQQGLPGLQQALWERLAFLNKHYPSRSLRGKPPLVVFPAASHSGREYRPEWETEMLDMPRVYAYLAQGKWYRRTTAKGLFNLGGRRYNARQSLARQMLEITFDPKTQELVCVSEDGRTSIRLAIQGLTKKDLMGELAPLTAVSHHQLLLPFSREAWRQSLLAASLQGTTL
ncbi:MAG TPA: transposase [Chloroflexi bacterium]|nr:transposase [Chloroflexota bacterium]